MTRDDVGKAAGDRLRVGAGILAGASRAGLHPGGEWVEMGQDNPLGSVPERCLSLGRTWSLV